MLARVTRRLDFAFYATVAKAARNQNTHDILELAFEAILKRFGIDQFEINAAILAGGRVSKRFVDTLIGVPDFKVFANHSNSDSFCRANDSLYKIFPACEIGLRGFQAQKIAHQLVQTFRVKRQRHLVNCVCDVAFFDYRFFRNAAEH